MKSSMIPILIALALGGCGRIEPEPLAEYLALAPAGIEATLNKRSQAFIDLYNHLEDDSIDERITKTYAEKLYFNDTLVTLHDRVQLIRYFKHTQKNLDAIEFKVLGIMDDGTDSYIRWLMKIRFSALGQTIDSQSIGITHLRFDAENKIKVHQDYWDSTQGLYQHLPVIGGLLRWIKSGFESY